MLCIKKAVNLGAAVDLWNLFFWYPWVSRVTWLQRRGLSILSSVKGEKTACDPEQ
jgi:hypothetical protein